MSTLFSLICDHVNTKALSTAKSEPKSGLFYNKSMTKDWEHVDAQIKIHGDLLKALMPHNLKNKRSDLPLAAPLLNMTGVWIT